MRYNTRTKCSLKNQVLVSAYVLSAKNFQPMNLSARVLEGELMDAPELEARLHLQALRGLQRVNRLSGTAQVIARAILQHCGSAARAGDRNRQLRVLDLACGGGDVTLAVGRSLIAAGLDVDMQGWDRSPRAIEFAKERSHSFFAPSPLRPTIPVRFEVHDVDDLAGEKEFDVVMCTLFLHHLDREAAVRCLSKMYRAASELVLVDDLRRTWVGYRLAQLGCRLLTRSPIVHVDGPLSVRAAFTEKELTALSREAGLPTPVFVRHWPQRFLMRWNR